MSLFTSSSESNEASSSLQRTSSRAEEPMRIPYADNVANIGMTVPNDTLAEAKVGKFSTKAAWLKWYDALKNILPIYIAVHLAFSSDIPINVIHCWKLFTQTLEA